MSVFLKYFQTTERREGEQGRRPAPFAKPRCTASSQEENPSSFNKICRPLGIHHVLTGAGGGVEEHAFEAGRWKTVNHDFLSWLFMAVMLLNKSDLC